MSLIFLPLSRERKGIKTVATIDKNYHNSFLHYKDSFTSNILQFFFEWNILFFLDVSNFIVHNFSKISQLHVFTCDFLTLLYYVCKLGSTKFTTKVTVCFEMRSFCKTIVI